MEWILFVSIAFNCLLFGFVLQQRRIIRSQDNFFEMLKIKQVTVLLRKDDNNGEEEKNEEKNREDCPVGTAAQG